ncbi:MAG: pantoate--beta-alanine ligase [Solirubrobacteraceae bacterium]
MRTVRTVAELRPAISQARHDGRCVGLVPTMGAFHDGHLSLIRRARADCDLVVVSLFVNPAQFDDAGDLRRYPRDEDRDAALAAELGVDLLFAPGVDEIYPPGFATTVSVGGLTERLEGAHRGRGHFDGVGTVVAKLLIAAAPDMAYFGRKDAQQVAVVRRLVADLGLPVRIVACPTVRAEDGLALSSRNALLSPADRERATALHRALRAVHDAIQDGAQDADAAVAVGTAELSAAGVTAEYLEVVDSETMAPVEGVDGPALAVVAARVGPVRLIDNLPVAPAGSNLPVDHDPESSRTDPEVATPQGAPTT